MRSNTYYTLTFESTHYAVAAENYLTPHLNVTVMPTLRKITASCGISLRIEEKDIAVFRKVISENRELVKNSRLYRVTDGEVTAQETE